MVAAKTKQGFREIRKLLRVHWDTDFYTEFYSCFQFLELQLYP